MATKTKKKTTKQKPVEGLGDKVENVLKKTGVKKIVEIFMDGKDCGCDKRKEKLNKIPFFQKFKGRCLTEDEYNSWSQFKKERTLKLSNDQVKYICRLYSDIFNKPYWEPCRNCSPKPLVNIIDRIDKVHEVYEKDLKVKK